MHSQVAFVFRFFICLTRKCCVLAVVSFKCDKTALVIRLCILLDYVHEAMAMAAMMMMMMLMLCFELCAKSAKTFRLSVSATESPNSSDTIGPAQTLPHFVVATRRSILFKQKSDQSRWFGSWRRAVLRPIFRNKIMFYLNSVNRKIRNGIIWRQALTQFAWARSGPSKYSTSNFLLFYLHSMLCFVHFSIGSVFGSLFAVHCFHVEEPLAVFLASKFIQSKIKITINSIID